MIRKQLYIDERQERALKRTAKALGITEAEILRRALDEVLGEAARRPPGRLKALDRFLERAEELAAAGHRLPRKIARDEIYEDREARLARR